MKRQLSPHRFREITYGSKVKQAPEEDSYPALDEKFVLRLQRNIGTQIYYANEVNNKLLVALIGIGAHQDSATVKTRKINQPAIRLLCHISR